MKQKSEFDKLVRSFFSDYLIGELDRRPNTVISYSDTFHLLLTFFKKVKRIRIEKLRLKNFTRSTVLEFLDWRQKLKNSGNVTRNVRLAAIHTFCRYLQLQKLEYLDEINRVLQIRQRKTVQKPIEYLTLEGIELLLNQPDRRTAQGRRHLAILCLIYDAGARVQEIIDATPSSLRLGKDPEIWLVGKGNKTRRVPLINAQLGHLNNYMKELNLHQPELNLAPLFFRGKQRARLTRVGVKYILKKYTEMARSKNPALIPNKITCHSLRHSKAMHLLQADVDMIDIRDFLGHDSLETTQLYARLHWDDMLAALRKANIKINLKQTRKWEEPALQNWLRTNFRQG